MEIVVRPANEEDRNFIYATWLRGLYYGSEFYGAIEKTVFFREYEKVLSGLLSQKLTKVDIASLKDDSTVILGYAVYEPGKALHYVFVKEAWRRQGLATQLVPEALQSVTHLTKLGNIIRLKKDLKFNPWLI